jgi:putrescine aminotransferase
VSLKNIEIMEREKMVDRVHDDIGPYFQKAVASLAGHPLVGEVRGKGLLAAIELVNDKGKREFFPEDLGVGTMCRNHCFENGLVMRAIRDTMVLAPPLIVTREQVDEIVRLARYCFDQTAKQLGRATS